MSFPIAAKTYFQNHQPLVLESDWSSFFAGLPGHLSSRVNKKPDMSSVRILTNEETGGSTAVKIFSTRGLEPAHTHYETKQIFIVLDGELAVWIDKEKEGGLERVEKILKRGEYVFINHGESHGFSGTALVGGVDIGKGTKLDTYLEGESPILKPEWSLIPMLPMSQGNVTIQTQDFEQRELLRDPNIKIGIMAEKITAKISSIAESDRLVVVVSGKALKTNQNEDTQECQPGDFFLVSSNESYTLSPTSEGPAIMIHFNLC